MVCVCGVLLISKGARVNGPWHVCCGADPPPWRVGWGRARWLALAQLWDVRSVTFKDGVTVSGTHGGGESPAVSRGNSYKIQCYPD